MGTGDRDPEQLAMLGRRVRAARERAGYSQRDLAAAAGKDFGYSWLQQLEQGARPDGKPPAPRPQPLIVLTELLNAKLTDGDKLDTAEILRLAGHDPDRYSPKPLTGRPHVNVRALAEKVQALPLAVQHAIETIVDSHLRATGHLPSTDDTPPALSTRGQRTELPTSLGQTDLTGPEHETAPESAGDRGQRS